LAIQSSEAQRKPSGAPFIFSSACSALFVCNPPFPLFLRTARLVAARPLRVEPDRVARVSGWLCSVLFPFRFPGLTGSNFFAPITPSSLAVLHFSTDSGGTFPVDLASTLSGSSSLLPRYPFRAAGSILTFREALMCQL